MREKITKGNRREKLRRRKEENVEGNWENKDRTVKGRRSEREEEIGRERREEMEARRAQVYWLLGRYTVNRCFYLGRSRLCHRGIKVTTHRYGLMSGVYLEEEEEVVMEDT